MKHTHYDSLSINADILMDLPMREGDGVRTNDVALSHPILLNNTPTWAVLGSGLNVLEFDGASEFADSPALNTADMDFMATDYTISMWINMTGAGSSSQILIARYQLDVGGWELYHYNGNFSLTLRHHHAAGGTVRTGAYSLGWGVTVWYHVGVVRSGATCAMYRDGVPLTVLTSPGGLIDPETTNRDLVIGTRFTKDADWYNGQMYRPKVWDRALSASEVLQEYNKERGWFP